MTVEKVKPWDFCFTLLLSIITLTVSYAQQVTTYAGTAGVSGYLDGPAVQSRFNSPHGVCTDRQGNVYVADRYNHRIRKILTNGTVVTLAGSGLPGSTDGTGMAASFNEPWALACDSLGNLYIADTKNYKIRKVTPSGVVATVAGTGIFGTTNGPVSTAQFGFPSGIAVKDDGSIIYVCDRMTHTIRKIENGQVTTLAGMPYLSGNVNGTGQAARFDHPYSICLDNNGNLIVADEWNHLIRKVTPAGVVSTIAGNGTAGNTNGNAFTASFHSPWAVVVDSLNNIYVGDGYNFTIRKITPAGQVSTYAGVTGMPGFSNGPALNATFNGITALAYFKSLHCLYAADSYNHLIRKIAPVSSITLTLTTSSPGHTFCADEPVTLIALPSGLSNYTFMEGSTILGTSSSGSLTLANMSVGLHAVHCTAVDNLGYNVTSDTIVITIHDNPVATITPAGTVSFCQGDSVMLTASAGNLWLWSQGATTQTIYVSATGFYSVTVTNHAGCTATSPVVTAIMNLWPSGGTTQNDTVCRGESAVLLASASPGVSFNWYDQPAGGIWLGSGAAFNTPVLFTTTTYYAEMQSVQGCINPNRLAAAAVVAPSPVLSFSYSLQSGNGNGLTVFFSNHSVNAQQFIWDFGDPTSPDNTSTLTNPVHQFSRPGKYVVMLIGINYSGCRDTLIQEIHVEYHTDVFIPSAFTPNDDGVNDLFRVRGGMIESVHMSIFNQWGECIYKAPLNVWDGKVKGHRVQNGTYVYLIQVTFKDHSTAQYKGLVTVIQ